MKTKVFECYVPKTFWERMSSLFLGWKEKKVLIQWSDTKFTNKFYKPRHIYSVYTKTYHESVSAELFNYEDAEKILWKNILLWIAYYGFYTVTSFFDVAIQHNNYYADNINKNTEKKWQHLIWIKKYDN